MIKYSSYVSKFVSITLIFCFTVTMVNADPTVTLTYSHDNNIVVSFRSIENREEFFTVVLGGSTPEVELSISEGQYEILAGRVEDFTNADRRVVKITNGTDQTIDLDPVGFSPAFELEQARADYLRSEAVMGTLQYQQHRNRNVRLFSLSGAVLAGAGMGAAFYLGKGAYDSYQSAVTTEEALAQRSNVEMAAGITIGTALAACVGLLTALIAHFSIPDDKDANDSLKENARTLRDGESQISSWPEFVSMEFVQNTDGIQ